jgi:tripartite ATP-independent transporter DctM subunit
MIGGIFTPTEAGVVAAFYALVIGLFVFRELKFGDLPRIFIDTMRTTVGVLFIVATATGFAWISTLENLPQILTLYVSQTFKHPLSFLIVLNILMLIFGCFLEGISIVVMLVPILLPSLLNGGIDLVHFGVLTAVNMSIGTITPPVGLVMYIVCDFAGISIEKFNKANLPFLLILIGVLYLVTFFPQLVLFLPNLFFGK